jgi:hypothetical protein
MSDKPETGTILFEVALLTVVALLVDELMMRAALSFIPAMLLAQRALKSSGTPPSSEPISIEIEDQNPFHEHVSKILEYFQKFYATCQLMASDEITPGEALSRTSDLEEDLSSLLDKVTKDSPG